MRNQDFPVTLTGKNYDKNVAMKRVPEIILFNILIMLLPLKVLADNIHIDDNLYSSEVILNDSINAKSFIEVDSIRLPIIPPSSGVQFYKDGIIFLSASKYESKMSAKQISFGTVEAYYAAFTDTALGSHRLFSTLPIFSYPCEALTFSMDYRTFYFTAIPKKDKKEKIFIGKFIPDSKSQKDSVMLATPLDFCSDNYNYSHPALSSDGNILVFASDRIGSSGGMDLFMSRRSDDKWSAPENLGKSINTSGNEFFPCLDNENNLYYSSDKLPGFGGYDIFTCKFNGTDWDKPVNLSDGINTDKDEIAFTINKTDGKTAFFTRRQVSGKGVMQLYRVVLKRQVTDVNLLTLSDVFNGKPAPKASLTAATSETDLKPATPEIQKTNPVTEPVKKEKVNVAKKATPEKKAAEKVTVTRPAPKPVVAETKAVETKKAEPASAGQNEEVIYRVQVFSGTNPQKSNTITINGKSYDMYEYVYLGVHRYTIGEFKTLAQAAVLQRACRQSGNSQAFVVAFKNNTRSLDPKLFK